jgi:hypothetical protein
MGQAHVKRWISEIMPLVTDDADPLGVRELATRHLALEDAPHEYEIFRAKADGFFPRLARFHPGADTGRGENWAGGGRPLSRCRGVYLGGF